MKTDAERLGDEKNSVSTKDCEQLSDLHATKLPKAYEKLQNATEKAIKRLTSKTK